jgi:serine/threonine protein kinase
MTPAASPSQPGQSEHELPDLPDRPASLLDGEREPSPDDLVNELLDGRYHILQRIADGGMGSVYRAVQTGAVGREVAIKVLNTSSLKNDVVVKRFENEARIIAQLRHPNTLRLIDSGRFINGRLYIVTDLLRGESLDRVIQLGPIDPRRMLRIMTQVCGSLAEAHALHIIHRDLKPANIFIEQVADQEVVKVLDFGIAKLANFSGLTAPMQIFGTPGYMSPEQARGEQVDARSDIYALGAIAYECLSGRPAYSGTNPVDVLMEQCLHDPPSLEALLPRTPINEEVTKFVVRLLSRNREERPESVMQVAEEIDRLQRCLDGLGEIINFMEPVEAQPQPKPAARPSSVSRASAMPRSPSQVRQPAAVPPSAANDAVGAAALAADLVEDAAGRSVGTSSASFPAVSARSGAYEATAIVRTPSSRSAPARRASSATSGPADRAAPAHSAPLRRGNSAPSGPPDPAAPAPAVALRATSGVASGPAGTAIVRSGPERRASSVASGPADLAHSGPEPFARSVSNTLVGPSSRAPMVLTAIVGAALLVGAALAIMATRMMQEPGGRKNEGPLPITAMPSSSPFSIPAPHAVDPSSAAPAPAPASAGGESLFGAGASGASGASSAVRRSEREPHRLGPPHIGAHAKSGAEGTHPDPEVRPAPAPPATPPAAPPEATGAREAAPPEPEPDFAPPGDFVPMKLRKAPTP